MTNFIKCTFPGMPDIMCATVAIAGGKGKLPAGCYRIGHPRIHPKKSILWSNLYRQKNNKDGWWDYSTGNPEIDCRGQFALHPGVVSKGCITVTDQSCFFNLMKAIKNNHPNRQFEVHKCKFCVLGECFFPSTTKQNCTTDLKVI